MPGPPDKERGGAEQYARYKQYDYKAVGSARSQLASIHSSRDAANLLRSTVTAVQLHQWRRSRNPSLHHPRAAGWQASYDVPMHTVT